MGKISDKLTKNSIRKVHNITIYRAVPDNPSKDIYFSGHCVFYEKQDKSDLVFPTRSLKQPVAE